MDTKQPNHHDYVHAPVHDRHAHAAADLHRLTASGGPFRDLPLDEFDSITPAMALRHPNWDMGPRITIGSATLMNTRQLPDWVFIAEGFQFAPKKRDPWKP